MKRDPRRQLDGQVPPQPLAINAGGETQVDAGQAPDLAEGPLGGGNIHHRQGLAPARPGDLTGDGEDGLPQPRLDRELLPAGQPELAGGGGAEEEDTLLEGLKAEILSGRGRRQGRALGLIPRGRLSLLSRRRQGPLPRCLWCLRPRCRQGVLSQSGRGLLHPCRLDRLPRGRRGLRSRRCHRQEGGRHPGEAEEVDAQDAQVSFPSRQTRLDLQQGAGLGNLRPLGQAEI